MKLSTAALAIAVLFFQFAYAEEPELIHNGDWYWSINIENEFNYAATSSTDDNMFGQYCYYDNSCLYLIGIPATCDEGFDYPVLFNSSEAALPLELTCATTLDSGLSVYVIEPFDDIDYAIRNSTGLIGFALAMESGKFDVYRFSLNGSIESMDEMRETTQQFINYLEQDQGLRTTESL